MKRSMICICFALLLISASCCAEEVEPSLLYDFAREYGAEEAAQGAYEAALAGETGTWSALPEWIKGLALEPLKAVGHAAAAAVAPVFLLGMMQACLPAANGGGIGVRFLLRMMLLLVFSELAVLALEAAQECMHSVKRFTDAVAPGITAAIAAMGMNGTASLVSPAAALAGGIAEGVFLNFGLPLCRTALCTAIAGNLSEAVDLRGFTKLLKKTANWGVGLITTLFTALVALQGNASEALDGVGVRTAKFAVDSASSVIGSGVSDAWDSYISGMLITKNALGISGIVALLAAGLRPVICCAAAMLLLNLAAALLELFGERETAAAAMQISGISQMALSLATGSLVIATVLLGAAMAVGKNFVG